MGQNTSSAVMQQRSEPHEIVSIQDARARGLKWYFTGRACSRGHIAKRNISNQECRHCVNAKRAAQRAADPEAARAKDRARHRRTNDARRKQSRASYQRNIEKRRKYDAQRYHENETRKADAKRRAAQWGRDNKGKRNRIIAARRAWVKRATPGWLTKADHQRIREIYLEAASYGPGVMHVDHIYPLRAKNFCGLHVPNNLQIIPAIDNIRKGNRFGSE